MTKFTIEDLRDIAYRGSYDDLERELALQLLASMEQAPVYLRPFGDDGETFVACDGNDERAITLYAAPQLPQPAVFVPSIKPDWMNNEFNAGWNACRAAMLNHSENERDMVERVSQSYKLPEEKGASLQLRNLIRKRHAEWSDSTFGNVGPIGPLKHLSKEALEAAAEPDDLSEWADMQFLLWDAQRRAGISDGEITAAMQEKLKVNMARQWPEPKDGEPRLHIKAAPQQEVK